MTSLVIWFPDDLRDQQRTAHPQNASEWNENTEDFAAFQCVARFVAIVVICSFTKDEFLKNRFSGRGEGAADLKFSFLIAGLHIEIIQR